MTTANPNLFCECPDDRCAGYHHAVGDPCGCVPLPMAPADLSAPACPEWCTAAAEHADEAADPSQEAYLHARRLDDGATPWAVDVCAWQWFDGAPAEPATIRVGRSEATSAHRKPARVPRRSCGRRNWRATLSREWVPEVPASSMVASWGSGIG